MNKYLLLYMYQCLVCNDECLPFGWRRIKPRVSSFVSFLLFHRDITMKLILTGGLMRLAFEI